MKAIRIQVDMTFQVPDDVAEEIYERDLGFFYSVKNDFEAWDQNPQEIRVPVSFELRHHMGLVEGVDESEEETGET